MSIESEYELKFHIYDGNERDISRYINEYDKLREIQREEGTVMSRVISYFFEALSETVKGDSNFWDGKIKEAQDHYDEAKRMYSRFRNSRNVQARLDYLSDRMIARITGLINITDGIITEDKKNKNEFFTEALKNFNDEVSLANDMEETMSSYAAFARASFAEARLLLNTAQIISDRNSGDAKRKLMKARDSIRQASFIDPRYQTVLTEVEDNLDDLTKSRLLVKAENYGDKATIQSENGEYQKAKENFKRAGLFYRRASSLAADTSSRRFLLSSATIYEASELEAEGNMLFRRDNETVGAAKKFDEAAKQVDKAIALMGSFGSKTLEQSFSSQRDYYQAMSMQANAISLFDQDKYNEARTLFNDSLELFKTAIEEAKKGDNDVIITLSDEARADIKGYLSMVDAMA